MLCCAWFGVGPLGWAGGWWDKLKRRIYECIKIQCQGQILSAESDDYFLIQYFSWIDGGTTNQELIPFSEMTGWKFYETNEDMIERERRHRR
jgi:hypothetical protein